MFSAQKLKQYAKDILFPPFSERELVTLAYLIALVVVVAVIKDPSIITSGLAELWERLTFQSSYPISSLTDVLSLISAFVGALLGMAQFIIYGLFTLFVYYILYDIAMQQRKESFETKKYVAYLFYAALSLMSVMVLLRSSEYSFVELFFTPLFTGQLDLSVLFNNIIMGFLLLRSTLTALVTYAYSELDMKHLLAMRMTDKQMSRAELIMLIVAATALFLVLLQGHDRLAAVLLSYFYVTLLFDIYRKIFPQPDPAFIKSIKKIKLK